MHRGVNLPEYKVGIRVREGESFESAIRRFKKDFLHKCGIRVKIGQWDSRNQILATTTPSATLDQE